MSQEKIKKKYINAFSSYSAKTKRDGRTDRQYCIAISPVPGLRRGGDNNLLLRYTYSHLTENYHNTLPNKIRSVNSSELH